MKPDAKWRSAHADTQREATGRARESVQKAGGGDVVVHDRQGKVRDAKTVAPVDDTDRPRDGR